MKIGFNLTSAICVYGNGEVNTVTKKIFLKKNLNYIEPEIEEEEEPIYDPTKDYNYQQQQKIESDVILSGFPFKLEQPRSVIMKICQLLDFSHDVIRYYYSFEFLNRQTGLRSFHMIISLNSKDAKISLMNKLKNFGILCFQNFFDNPVNEYDNTLISHDNRLTNLNYVIRKELDKLQKDKWIAEYKFENHQFHAKQKEEWIIVKDLEVVDILRTPEVQDVPDDEIEIWDEEEEQDSFDDKLQSLRQHFKTQSSKDDWLQCLRRPSQIVLEPLESNTERSFEFKYALNSAEKDTNGTSWVRSLSNNDDAITMGLSMNEII